jgi:hypothetical protein
MPPSEKQLAAKPLSIRRNSAAFENLANAILIEREFRHSEFSRSANRFDRQYHRALQASTGSGNRENKKYPVPNSLKPQKTKDRSPKTKATKAIKSHSRPI